MSPSELNDQIRLLRVVTLGSESGLYGGPFDTAVRQARLAINLDIVPTVFAGHFEGDRPTTVLPQGGRVCFVLVRNWLPSAGFAALFSFSLICTLWREVARSSLVHISFSRESIPVITAIFAFILRKPYICQPHGMLTTRTSALHRIFDIGLRPLVKRAAQIVALTSKEADSLTTWDPAISDRLKTLGNPIAPGTQPVERKFPVRQEALFIARLHPRKHVRDFINAAEYSSNERWPVSYTVIGPEGGEKNFVVESVATHDNVSYEGVLTSDGVTQRVANTGVFVLPSENEPWGNVLILAIAAGVPVVVCRSAALAASIEEYGAGAVVPDGDSASIARAVRRLLSDSEKYHKASRGALRMADQQLNNNYQREQLAILYHAT